MLSRPCKSCPWLILSNNIGQELIRNCKLDQFTGIQCIYNNVTTWTRSISFPLLMILTKVVSMRLCVLVTWTFEENNRSSIVGLFSGGLSSYSSKHSSSAKDTKLLYQCALLALWGFDGSWMRFKSLLKLRLRLIGCRLRFITAGNSAALPLNSNPIFRRNDFRSILPLSFSSSATRFDRFTSSPYRSSS